MNSGKAIVLLIALFLTGAVSGGFVGYNVAIKRHASMPVAIQNEPPKSPPWGSPRGQGGRPFESTRDRLTRELSLTEEQLVKIDPIITAFDAQLKAMSDQNFNSLALAISNRNEQLKQHLTPEQVQKLEERSKRMGPRPFGPGQRDHNRPPSEREDRRKPEDPRD